MRTLEGPACQAFPGKSLPLSGCALPDVQNPNFPQEDMFGGWPGARVTEQKDILRPDCSGCDLRPSSHVQL